MLIQGLPQVDSGIVALIIAVVGLIAWFTRLESKGGTNYRDIEKLEKRQDEHEKRLSELDNRLMDKLSNIERLVAKIEGQLSTK